MTDLIPYREQAEVVHLPDPSLAEQMKILALANTKAKPKETIHIEASVQRALFYIKKALKRVRENKHSIGLFLP